MLYYYLLKSKSDTAGIECENLLYVANGYYVSGVFRINDSSSELDPGSECDKSSHYNNVLKVVMY